MISASLTRKWLITSALTLAVLCVLTPADATRLQVDESAPMLARWGAALLLYLHIGGGAIGLIAGLVATLSRKGRVFHRNAGKVFLTAMTICFGIGAGVAPFLDEGQRPNFVAGVLALYLLWSGFSAVQRPRFKASWREKTGLAIALAVVAMGVTFMVMGVNSESGTVDGSPPQAFFLFITFGSLAAIGEVRVLIRGRLSGPARIRRHLGRMCLAFFIASGSLFLGQPRVFPEAFNQSWWPLILAFYPLMVAVLFGLLNLIRWRKKPMRAASIA